MEKFTIKGRRDCRAQTKCMYDKENSNKKQHHRLYTITLPFHFIQNTLYYVSYIFENLQVMMSLAVSN